MKIVDVSPLILSCVATLRPLSSLVSDLRNGVAWCVSGFRGAGLAPRIIGWVGERRIKAQVDETGC